jgi:BirA family transcriptional regulator, biotin operon repressor / biotin---[acetyl-CoA-carboxylase] ligase
MNLDAVQISEGLGPPPTAWEVRVHEEVASTSDLVRDLGMAGGQHGLVIFAEHQTAGRGRRENRWLMPRGSGLMFSMLLRPQAPMALWPRLTTLTALAICKGIESELPLSPRIKWPNDIYLTDKKVSGLLAESFTSTGGSFIVIGIGLNVNNTTFPPELQDTATSLCRELQSEVPVINRNALAAALLRSLHEEFTRLDDGFSEAMEEVRTRSWLIGKTIRARVDGREIFGRATDLNHEGHLQLALPEGSVRSLSSADEVRWVV